MKSTPLIIFALLLLYGCSKSPSKFYLTHTYNNRFIEYRFAGNDTISIKDLIKVNDHYVIDGHRVVFWHSGDTSQYETYKMGSLDGWVKWFYMNNIPYAYLHFKDNNLNGHGIFLYNKKNSNLKMTYFAINGRFTRDQIFYDTTGNVQTMIKRNAEGEEEFMISYSKNKILSMTGIPLIVHGKNKINIQDSLHVLNDISEIIGAQQSITIKIEDLRGNILVNYDKKLNTVNSDHNYYVAYSYQFPKPGRYIYTAVCHTICDYKPVGDSVVVDTITVSQ